MLLFFFADFVFLNEAQIRNTHITYIPHSATQIYTKKPKINYNHIQFHPYQAPTTLTLSSSISGASCFANSINFIVSSVLANLNLSKISKASPLLSI